MSVVASVAVSGALGAVSRYGLDRVIEQRSESSFPWSTFVINVTGCLLVGFLIAALVDRRSAPEWLRAGLVIGFCGGYTTFSTFGQETLDLIEADEVGAGGAQRVRQRRGGRARNPGGCVARATRVTSGSAS